MQVGDKAHWGTNIFQMDIPGPPSNRSSLGLSGSIKIQNATIFNWV